MDFHGQVIVVAGGSRGVGRETVRMLAERGATVLFAFRQRSAEADATIARCADLPGTVQALQCDLRLRADAEKLIEQALSLSGQIDGLINCIGQAYYAPIEAISDDQWLNVLRTNLDSIFFTCKAVLRPMMKRRYGRIVNLAALHGVAGGPAQADYSAATGGVLGLTRALAREAAPWNITVNAIIPGLIETEQLDVIPAEQRAWGEQVIALRRVARPEEVAAAAIFLASPLASYITGITLPVDGGWRMA